MKTQLIVTITQTGETKLAASLLERDLRTIVKDIWDTPESSVTVRHVVDDTEPAADTLEALVREYGTSPTTGKGRVRSNVLDDIRAMFPNGGTQVAANSAKPSVPVEDTVANLNKQMADSADPDVRVGQKRLHGLLVDTHRAGQMTGRLLGKEGREKAAAFADNVVAVLVHV